MSLELDARQRAMLEEMGVRVWSPLHPSGMDEAPAELKVPNCRENGILPPDYSLSADNKLSLNEVK